MEHEDNYKPIIILTVVLLLFYCSSLFQLIPISLFNIDMNNCSTLVLNLVRLFPNIVFSVILFLIYRKDLKKDFGNLKDNFNSITDTAIKYWIFGFIGMIITNLLIGTFTPVKISNNEQSIREMISQTPAIAFLFISIFAPFTEELVFRKSFKDALKGKWLFVLTSGLVFGALHIVGNITSLYGLLYIFPYSILGSFFALTYYETNNIFSTFLIHFTHNSLLLILEIIGIGGILLWTKPEKKEMKN